LPIFLITPQTKSTGGQNWKETSSTAGWPRSDATYEKSAFRDDFKQQIEPLGTDDQLPKYIFGSLTLPQYAMSCLY
jgi:hypothetical protein